MTTIKYQNGNCRVSLYPDGTKVRQWDGQAAPEFPESIDLKITDYCDAGCPFCHEQSTIAGKCAGLDHIQGLLHGLPPGVEIAIGGGNPLSHPELVPLLEYIKGQGLISNLTIRLQHYIENARLIKDMSTSGLIHGIGISMDNVGDALLDGIDAPEALPLPENHVLHLIAGIARPMPLLARKAKGMKVLILGYKRYGFGEGFFDDRVESRLAEWRYWIGPVMRNVGIVSFDNLALEQLRVREKLDKGVWDSSYMGDDGQFTMYVDAVRMEYAISSTSQRSPLNGMTARQAFNVL